MNWRILVLCLCLVGAWVGVKSCIVALFAWTVLGVLSLEDDA